MRNRFKWARLSSQELNVTKEGARYYMALARQATKFYDRYAKYIKALKA